MNHEEELTPELAALVERLEANEQPVAVWSNWVPRQTSRKMPEDLAPEFTEEELLVLELGYEAAKRSIEAEERSTDHLSQEMQAKAKRMRNL